MSAPRGAQLFPDREELISAHMILPHGMDVRFITVGVSTYLLCMSEQQEA
jgi:hypothetical protein